MGHILHLINMRQRILDSHGEKNPEYFQELATSKYVLKLELTTE